MCRGFKIIAFAGSLALLGVICGIINTPASYAASYDVTATVPAPLPTGPPVITSPLDQQRFTTNSITVEGTCSPNTAYVVINRNAIIAGTAPCLGGFFSLQITLFPGTNLLIARSFSSTDGEGPSSTPVTVYWDIPPNTQPASPTSSLPRRLAPPSFTVPTAPSAAFEEGSGVLYLSYKPQYITREPGKIWRWLFTVHGGTPPYALKVFWDDTTDTTYTPDANGHITIEHIYYQQGVFTPTAIATDSRDATASLQFFAVVQGEDMTISSGVSPFSWVVIIILISLLALLALFDAGLLAASIMQFRRHRKDEDE